MTSWIIPGFLDFADHTLTINGIHSDELATQFGTPLFVFSEARIWENIQAIRQAFEDHIGSRARIFYASKANSNLAILQSIRQSGIGIEVNSGGELYKALRAGFQPDQIVYNGVAKTHRELREAIQNQIYCINVDSAYELDQIIAIAGELGIQANIALRIVPEVQTDAHGGIRTGTHDTKFGISEHLLNEVYHKAVQHSDQLALRGLHMHIGAQVTDPEKYRQAFEVLVRKAAQLYEMTGYAVSNLNMGGGLPVSFVKDTDSDHQLPEYRKRTKGTTTNVEVMLRAGATPTDVANATVGLFKDEAFIARIEEIAPGFSDHLRTMTILLEPGSRIIADSAVLLTRIQNHKFRESTGQTWLLIDAGFNTLLDMLSYNWYFHAIAASQIDSPHDFAYKLGGPLCDSGDVYHDSEELGRLPDYRSLPAAMKPGDLLAFFDVGAYTLEQMLEYNGQPQAAAIMIMRAGHVCLIRKRQTYEDLCIYDVMLEENSS